MSNITGPCKAQVVLLLFVLKKENISQHVVHSLEVEMRYEQKELAN
jgi:hypothetical protein